MCVMRKEKRKKREKKNEEKAQQWEKCSQVEVQQKKYSPSQYPSSSIDCQGRKTW